uniref:Non-structural replication polyprotein n=1 Tax=Piper methysticum tymovirus 1 TaxID=2794437 RepID=A0A7T5QZE7_9VIRU|nr:replicase [Piper methysticum tymovirus 1]
MDYPSGTYIATPPRTQHDHNLRSFLLNLMFPGSSIGATPGTARDPDAPALATFAQSAHFEVILSRAVEEYQTNTNDALLIAPFAMTPVQRGILAGYGIPTTTLGVRAIDHPMSKAIENMFRYKLIPAHVKGPVAVFSMRESKARDVKQVSLLHNQVRTPRDLGRYSAKDYNTSLPDALPCDQLLIHDAGHFVTPEYALYLFRRYPELKRIYMTAIIPWEYHLATSYDLAISFQPALYTLKKTGADTFRYILENNLADSYEQPLSCTKWLTTSLITDGEARHSVELLHSIAAHHLFCITRDECPNPDTTRLLPHPPARLLPNALNTRLSVRDRLLPNDYYAALIGHAKHLTGYRKKDAAAKAKAFVDKLNHAWVTDSARSYAEAYMVEYRRLYEMQEVVLHADSLSAEFKIFLDEFRANHRLCGALLNSIVFGAWTIGNSVYTYTILSNFPALPALETLFSNMGLQQAFAMMKAAATSFITAAKTVGFKAALPDLLFRLKLAISAITSAHWMALADSGLLTEIAGQLAALPFTHPLIFITLLTTGYLTFKAAVWFFKAPRDTYMELDRRLQAPEHVLALPLETIHTTGAYGATPWSAPIRTKFSLCDVLEFRQLPNHKHQPHETQDERRARWSNGVYLQRISRAAQRKLLNLREIPTALPTRHWQPTNPSKQQLIAWDNRTLQAKCTSTPGYQLCLAAILLQRQPPQPPKLPLRRRREAIQRLREAAHSGTKIPILPSSRLPAPPACAQQPLTTHADLLRNTDLTFYTTADAHHSAQVMRLDALDNLLRTVRQPSSPPPPPTPQYDSERTILAFLEANQLAPQPPRSEQPRVRFTPTLDTEIFEGLRAKPHQQRPILKSAGHPTSARPISLPHTALATRGQTPLPPPPAEEAPAPSARAPFQPITVPATITTEFTPTPPTENARPTADVESSNIDQLIARDDAGELLTPEERQAVEEHLHGHTYRDDCEHCLRRRDAGVPDEAPADNTGLIPLYQRLSLPPSALTDPFIPVLPTPPTTITGYVPPSMQCAIKAFADGFPGTNYAEHFHTLEAYLSPAALFAPDLIKSGWDLRHLAILASHHECRIRLISAHPEARQRSRHHAGVIDVGLTNAPIRHTIRYTPGHYFNTTDNEDAHIFPAAETAIVSTAPLSCVPQPDQDYVDTLLRQIETAESLDPDRPTYTGGRDNCYSARHHSQLGEFEIEFLQHEVTLAGITFTAASKGFSAYKPNRARAKTYMRAIKEGEGLVLSKNGHVAGSKQPLSELRKKWDSACDFAPTRTVRALALYGHGGCAKSYPVMDFFNRHRKYYKASIIVTTERRLRKSLADSFTNYPGHEKGNISTHEIAVLGYGNILVLDEASKFPRGYLDFFLMTHPTISHVIITGDHTQLHAPADPTFSNASLINEAQYFINAGLVSMYSLYTFRSCRAVARYEDITTYSRVEGFISFKGKHLPGPTASMSNKARDFIATSGGDVYNAAQTQGFTFEQPLNVVVDYDLGRFITPNMLNVLLNRSKAGVNFIDLADKKALTPVAEAIIKGQSLLEDLRQGLIRPYTTTFAAELAGLNIIRSPYRRPSTTPPAPTWTGGGHSKSSNSTAARNARRHRARTLRETDGEAAAIEARVREAILQSETGANIPLQPTFGPRRLAQPPTSTPAPGPHHNIHASLAAPPAAPELDQAPRTHLRTRPLPQYETSIKAERAAIHSPRHSNPHHIPRLKNIESGPTRRTQLDQLAAQYPTGRENDTSPLPASLRSHLSELRNERPREIASREDTPDEAAARTSLRTADLHSIATLDLQARLDTDREKPAGRYLTNQFPEDRGKLLPDGSTHRPNGQNLSLLYPSHSQADPTLTTISVPERLRINTPEKNVASYRSSSLTGLHLWQRHKEGMQLPAHGIPCTPENLAPFITENDKQKLTTKTLKQLQVNERKSDPDWALNFVQVFMKSQQKVKLGKANSNAKAGQTLAQFNDAWVVIFGAIVRFMMHYDNESRPPTTMVLAGRTPHQADAWARQHCNAEEFIECDMTQFDQSQGPETLSREVYHMRHYSVPENLIDLYIWQKTHLRHQFGTSDVMRFTGEPATYYFNTCMNEAYLHCRYHLNGVAYAISGDDSLIVGVPNMRLDWPRFSKNLRLVAKEFRVTHPTFCGYYYSSHGIARIPVELAHKLIIASEKGELNKVALSFTTELMVGHRKGDDIYHILPGNQIEYHFAAAHHLWDNGGLDLRALMSTAELAPLLQALTDEFKTASRRLADVPARLRRLVYQAYRSLPLARAQALQLHE